MAAIQVAFSIFIVTETWPQFALGLGGRPLRPAPVGGVRRHTHRTELGINSMADSLILLYVAAVVGGIGVCAVTASTFGNAFKWFPDRRGLAVGLTSAGFGAGSALTSCRSST